MISAWDDNSRTTGNIDNLVLSRFVGVCIHLHHHPCLLSGSRVTNWNRPFQFSTLWSVPILRVKNQAENLFGVRQSACSGWDSGGKY